MEERQRGERDRERLVDILQSAGNVPVPYATVPVHKPLPPSTVPVHKTPSPPPPLFPLLAVHSGEA